MEIVKILESARSGRRRTGQTSLIKHLTGKRITQRQAIQAKCYECNGMGEQKDCDMEGCPLFSYSVYRLKGKSG